jgi:hypothetical protein
MDLAVLVVQDVMVNEVFILRLLQYRKEDETKNQEDAAA